MDVLRAARDLRAVSPRVFPDNFRSAPMLRDERGAGTVMGLLWFMLIVGVCGMAVDVTDGFRSRTMLQATADSSALAAAIDLPNEATAKATAVNYAAMNMPVAINGSVLVASDVVAGAWDNDSRTFTPSSDVATGTPLDAVYVMTKRDFDNENPIATNFLRIIGWDSWNVRAQAIAQRYLPDCLNDGLIAREQVDISSNNSFVNHICVHGQKGVKMQSGNYFEPGVIVSMLDMETLQIPSSGLDSNTGLSEALREQGLQPREVNHTDEIMSALVDKNDPNFAAYVPSYIDTSQPVIEVNEKFDLGSAESGRIYHVLCKPNKNASIPNNSVLQNVVIIAECELHIGTSSFIMNAVLGSRSGGKGKLNKADVVASAQVQLGLPDNCTPGGGVRIYSNATIHTAATTGIDGVQLVAKGDIELGARDMGINGISAQSGQNVDLTSNNMFGLCSGNTDALLTVDYYRLVL